MKRNIAALVVPALGAMLVGVAVPAAAVADTTDVCAHAAGHGLPELQGCVDPELVEAEDAELTAGLTRGDAHTGYSGSSFIGTLYDEGAAITFDAYHPGATSDTGTLRIRYANGGDPRTFSLYADGVKVRQLSFPKVSDSWDAWSWLDVADVPMSGDVTTLSLRVDSGDTGKANIDAFSYVSGNVTFAPVPLGTSWIGVPFSQQLGVVGGVKPYVFAITSGAAPEGLTLTADGLLAGTPTSSAPATFTVTATDHDGLTASRTLTFQVSAVPVISAPATTETSRAITVTGAGFVPGESVVVSWDPAGGEGATVTASATGVISAEVTAPAAAGTYDVVATGGESSAHATIAVAKRASLVALSADHTSSAYGDDVVLTATAGPVATGTVEFFDGATSLGTATLTHGSAALTTKALTKGVHHVTAAYSGDDGLLASTSAPLLLTVSKRTSTVVLSVDHAAVTAGRPVVLSAVLATGSTGTVEFFDGERSLGTAAALNARATLTVTSLPVGTHRVAAVYYGDGQSLPAASGDVTITVSKGTVTLARPVLSATTVPFSSTKPVTVTTVVKGATSGTVVFRSGSRALGSAPVVKWGSAYRATLTLPSSLAVGHYGIVAGVSATASLNAATSTTSPTLTVRKAAVKSLSVTGKRYKKGDKVALTVKISSTLDSGRATSGSVKVYAGKKLVKTVKLTSFRSGTAKVVLAKGYSTAKKISLKVVFVPSSSSTTATATSTAVVKRR